MHTSSVKQRASFLTLGGLFAATLATAGAVLAQAQPTAVPVQLEQTLDSAHLKAGDAVRMKTLQPVVLDKGQSIPKSTQLEGHVVAERAYQMDPTPYAPQTTSRLSIRIEAIVTASGRIPVAATLRALADAPEADAARNRQYQNEFDTEGMIQLVGSEQLRPWDRTIRDKHDAVVGYERKQGNVARLLESLCAQEKGTPLHCTATASEQAIGVFSADACGLYGLEKTVLISSGTAQEAITFERSQGNVHLERGSAALLMVSAL